MTKPKTFTIKKDKEHWRRFKYSVKASTSEEAENIMIQLDREVLSELAVKYPLDYQAIFLTKTQQYKRNIKAEVIEEGNPFND